MAILDAIKLYGTSAKVNLADALICNFSFAKKQGIDFFTHNRPPEENRVVPSIARCVAASSLEQHTMLLAKTPQTNPRADLSVAIKRVDPHLNSFLSVYEKFANNKNDLTVQEYSEIITAAVALINSMSDLQKLLDDAKTKCVDVSDLQAKLNRNAGQIANLMVRFAGHFLSPCASLILTIPAGPESLVRFIEVLSEMIKEYNLNELVPFKIAVESVFNTQSF